MKILFHGNKDKGSILLFSLVMLAVLVLCIFPVMQTMVQDSSFEKKRYEKLCDEIEQHNTNIRAVYEIN